MILTAKGELVSMNAGSPFLSPEPAPVDQPRIRRAVRELLAAIGEDPDRDGLTDTPARVGRAWAELFGGLREDAAAHLARTFEQDSEDVVSLRDIEFSSCCEHHLLPVFGRAHIAYLPSQRRVVGLSKLARTVDVFARRPQLQERMTAQIADALMEHLEPQGALVVVEAEHMCMKMRGVRKSQPVMMTYAHRGVFTTDRELRSEILSLLTGAGGAQSTPIAPWSDAAPAIVNEGARLHAVGVDDARKAAL
jgi:GTP cyclohydrolase I